MDAFSLLVLVLVWGTGWGWLPVHMARRYFTEPDVPFTGLPGRVWAGLILAWSWPVIFVVEITVNLPLWPVFAVGPAGLLVLICETVLNEWNRRSPV
jgi:hypothetical protein